MSGLGAREPWQRVATEEVVGAPEALEALEALEAVEAVAARA
jgi:hypothetical protein